MIIYVIVPPNTDICSFKNELACVKYSYDTLDLFISNLKIKCFIFETLQRSAEQLSRFW